MTTTFLGTLNSMLPAPKNFHRIAYSDTANLSSYLTPTDPHDFAYDYTAGVLMVKTNGTWAAASQTNTNIFKEYTVNCVPPDPYYGIVYNGIPDVDWPPQLHWGSIYVSDSWTPVLASNAHTGELAIINELTYILAMTPAGLKLNWAELDQSPTGTAGFVHENDPTINRPILVTATLTNPTLTDALMTDSTIERTLLLTSSLVGPAITGGTLDNSEINSPTVTAGTFDGSTIANATINDSTTNNEFSYDATLFNAQINNGTLDNATLNSPALNTATITASTLDDIIVTSATISTSNLNDSNIADAAITTSSMSNSSIDHTSIDFSTVNGSTVNDAIISTSNISFTTITDSTIGDTIINTSVLNSPELVTPDLGTPTNGDLRNCTFPIATTTDLGSVMIDNDSITISGTGVITAASTRVVKELVKNSTGSTILKGQAVYISGANGTNILVSLAQANVEAKSSKTLGVAATDILNGSSGYVIVHGMLSGINTIDAGAAGDPVWLSPTTPGGFDYGLTSKPVAPNHLVYLGVVSRKHAVNGEIFVKVQNGYEIDELHDVLVTSPADGQVITYESSTSLWKNKSLAAQANTWTATQAFAGTASNLATLFTNTSEVVALSNTAANNTITFDVTSQAIMYSTVNAAGNWTVNFRASSSTALDTVMAVGQSVTLSLLVTQGSTAYYNSTVTIDGTTVTPKYQGGTAITSGNANGIDMYTYTIIKTGTSTFTVLMSLTNFG